MVAETNPAVADASKCLISPYALLTLSNPDAVGLLDRRSNLSGWYNYHFSLRNSQLLYFEHGQSRRRGLLVDKINLFHHKLTLINTLKRRREFEIVELSGKVHVLRAASDAELHWWVQLFNQARQKVPPAQPIDPAISSPTPDGAHKQDESIILPSSVGPHLSVDHVLCVVHGIGVSPDILATNTRALQESFREIMAKVFPDVEFRVEVLVIHWREALTRLDVHRKLHAVVPVAPLDDEGNPLRQFMVHRIVDYVYYTHDRYRRHILREVASQLNTQIAAFRRRRPEFDGQISVMAHSLGAALCYDLLCRKVHDDQVLLEAEGMRLDFDASNLFCLGNPLGTLLGLDPTIGLGADMLKLPFRILNVFKYYDPLATRLEPLCDLGAVEVCPVTVPCWFNMGLRESTAQWFGSLWQGGKKKKDIGEGESCGGESPRYLRGESGGKGRRSEHGSSVAFQRMQSSDGSSAENVGSAGDDGRRNRDEGGQDGAKRSDELNGNFSQGIEAGKCRENGELFKGGVRLDYALQASSTMEDMSTSWSALKAHTEYWANRDAMLLMVSAMMKSTFRLEDEERWSVEMERRVVDEDILHKSGGVGWKEGSDGQEEGESIESVVEGVVERLVDEAVAMHELLLTHPQVRMRSGGVTTRSPMGSKVEVATGTSGRGSGRGWASYLGGGWFSAEGKTDGSENGNAEGKAAGV